MSLKLVEVLNAEVLLEILDKDAPVEEVVENLFRKGMELAGAIKEKDHADWDSFKKEHSSAESELVELEGPSDLDDKNVVILRDCPMAETMKKLYIDGQPPEFHNEIIKGYKAQNPGSNAVLHPGCIAHQVARQLVVKHIKISGKQDLNYYQLACRSGASGKIVYDDNGLKAIGMSEEQAAKLIEGWACLYVLVKNG